MKCSHCGAKLANDAKFCNMCGQPVNIKEESASKDPSGSLPFTAASTISGPEAKDNSANDEDDPIDLATSETESTELTSPDMDLPDNPDEPISRPQPPATLLTDGPITPTPSRTPWRIIMVVVLLLVFGGGGLYVWFIFNGGLAKSTVSTDCYSFKVPSKLLTANDGTVCGAVADTFDNSVSVQLLPAKANEVNLQDYAQKGDANAKKTTFAGRPAYKTSETKDAGNGKTLVSYYIYDTSSTLKINGNKFGGFVATFGSRQDLDALVSTADKSWQWKTQEHNIDPLSGYVPVEDGNTSCYNLTLPSDAKAYLLDSCALRVTYGAGNLSTFQVRDLIGDHTTIKGYVDDWKKSQVSNVSVKSETDIKIGDQTGHKIVFNYDSISGAGDQVIIFVYTAGKYSSQGMEYGIELYGDYDSSKDQKAKVDDMISTWDWK